MIHVGFLVLALSLSSNSFASPLLDFEGRYVKVEGEKLVEAAPGSGLKSVICPESLEVLVGDGSVEILSSGEEFNSFYTTDRLDGKIYGCHNKGNPFANTCYRGRVKKGKIVTESGSKSILPLSRFKVERFWKMQFLENDNLEFSYNDGESETKACIYQGK